MSAKLLEKYPTEHCIREACQWVEKTDIIIGCKKFRAIFIAVLFIGCMLLLLIVWKLEAPIIYYILIVGGFILLVSIVHNLYNKL